MVNGKRDMKRRADVQRYIHILSKLLGFSLSPKCRRAQKERRALWHAVPAQKPW
jgi:hypothetical protein